MPITRIMHAAPSPQSDPVFYHGNPLVKPHQELPLAVRVRCRGGPLDGEIVQRSSTSSRVLFCMTAGRVQRYELVRLKESLAHKVETYVFRGEAR